MVPSSASFILAVGERPKKRWTFLLLSCIRILWWALALPKQTWQQTTRHGIEQRLMREQVFSFFPKVSDYGCFQELGQWEEMSYLRLWTLFKLFWVNICINSPPIEKTKDLECKYEKGRGQGTDVFKEKVPWWQRHGLCVEHWPFFKPSNCVFKAQRRVTFSQNSVRGIFHFNLLLLCSRRNTLVTNAGELNFVLFFFPHNSCIQQKTNVFVIRGENKHNAWSRTWNCITSAKWLLIELHVCFPCLFFFFLFFLWNLHLPVMIIAY